MDYISRNDNSNTIIIHNTKKERKQNTMDTNVHMFNTQSNNRNRSIIKMQNDKTSIQISRKTRDMLKDLAVTESESYENIILRLIMLHKKEMKELLN